MKLFTLLSFLCLVLTVKAQQSKNKNKHFSYTLETKAEAANIWKIWINVNQWKKWDTGLKDAQMLEEFSLNAKGYIISLEGRKSKFKVVAFEPGKSYTFRTKLPFGSLYVKRYLSKQNTQVQFTHEVWFKGLTAGIFAKSFGKKFREMLPEVMQNIKNQAEKSWHSSK